MELRVFILQLQKAAVTSKRIKHLVQRGIFVVVDTIKRQSVVFSNSYFWTYSYTCVFDGVNETKCCMGTSRKCVTSLVLQSLSILGVCVYVSVLKNSRNLKIKPRCFVSHMRHAVLDREAEREVTFICFTIIYFLGLFWFFGVFFCLFGCALLLGCQLGSHCGIKPQRREQFSGNAF